MFSGNNPAKEQMQNVIVFFLSPTTNNREFLLDLIKVLRFPTLKKNCYQGHTFTKNRKNIRLSYIAKNATLIT